MINNHSSVLIVVNEDGLKIDANQAFKLTIPTGEIIENKSVPETVGQQEELVFY